MKGLTVLMYHALVNDSAALDDIDPEERSYALTAREFTAQLELLRQAAIPVLDPATLRPGSRPAPGVLITFDDGHASNAELALPLLERQSMKAAFFITTDFVARRRGYCTWEQVRSLAERGMLVGAHGHTHRFLSTLDDVELRAELQGARDLLRDHAGVDATQLSFPGGRFDRRAERLARDAGYRTLFGSRFGTIAAHRDLPLDVLPRIAVRPGLSERQFLAYARASSSAMIMPRLSAWAKDSLRSVIGDERYHQIYRYFRG